MLTKIVMVLMIVGSDGDMLVLKLLHLNKFLPEQSSVQANVSVYISWKQSDFRKRDLQNAIETKIQLG